MIAKIFRMLFRVMHLLTCINANNMVFMLSKIQFIEFILSTLFVNNFLMNNEINITFVVLYDKFFWSY